MKRSKSISITCFLFVSCLWGVCAGDGPVRITVNIDGGADFTSIQEALDSANSGDEIRVAPGTYNEAINFLGKAVHLYSSGGPSATIIDAGGLNASVVTCNTGENPDTILEGFTLTGGNSFSGGGMSIHYSSPTVKNCLFTGNSASTSGGGMYTIGSSPTVINSIFIENATEGFGGGMFNTSSSAPILINCTFTRNSGFGGGIVNWLYSTPALTNCIVWGNFSVGSYAQIHNESGSTETVTYSCVQGGKPDIGNRHVNPRFVDAAGGNVRLSDGSPCIDAGNNAAVPVSGYTDIDGNRRIADGNGDGNAIVDMGAYEFNSALPPHNITKSQSYPTIQAAIVDADNGDQIEVSPGTYYEAINFLGKAVRLYSSGGPDVTIINGTGHYHVVQCVSREGPDTILEGFTITGGNANGPENDDKRGGGMRNFSSSPTVIGCIFTANSAVSAGGGMCNQGGSPTVTDCTFTNNTTNDSGGGMFSWSGTPIITRCVFTGNSAGQRGGGMENFSSSPTVTHCTFSGNSAPFGGGMSNQISRATVFNCTFTGNTAAYFGGGMQNGGGGSIDGASPTVINCTFTGNSASTSGGAISNVLGGKPTITNSILWGNTAPEIHIDSNSSPTFTYCAVQGASLWPGTGNINANPLFVNAAAGNLRLSFGSPCIDAGNNAAVPAGTVKDLDGNLRIRDGNGDGTAIVDMGAYEFDISAFSLNVTKNQFYSTIQAAIGDADTGDEIEVSPGTYFESINFLGKAVHVYSSGGPEVTIIDGTGHYHVIECVSGEGLDTILEGFTLTGGNANGPTDPDKRGGGMRIYLSSPTVIGCIFKNNVSDAHGGGMYIESGSPAPTVINCIFDGNMASDGGGMYSRNSSPTVVDCLFENNTTSLNGGGMYNFASRPTITHSSFLNNTANGTGGGMYSREQSHLTITHSTFSGNYAGGGGGAMVNTIYTHPKMTNCVFIGNTTPSRGGAIYNYFHSNPTITHCTFSRNTADDGGGGIYNNVNCTPTVVNSILWDNSPDPFLNVNSTPTVTYSTIQSDSLWPGDGNINADPLFVDAAGGNLRLGRSSPCIDAGNNAAVPAGVMTDLGGWPRFIDDPCTTDTGSGSGAIVDMGSHEFMPADIDDSGAVNLADFALLSALWQQSDGDLAGVDMNCDGVIDLADMMILATWWLEGK